MLLKCGTVAFCYSENAPLSHFGASILTPCITAYYNVLPRTRTYYSVLRRIMTYYDVPTTYYDFETYYDVLRLHTKVARRRPAKGTPLEGLPARSPGLIKGAVIKVWGFEKMN